MTEDFKEAKRRKSTSLKSISLGNDDPLVASVKKQLKKYSQQDPDPFTTSYVNGVTEDLNIIEPSFNPEKLIILINTNDVLKQVVKCIQVNTVGNGYSLNYIGADPSMQTDDKIKAKKQEFLDILDNPNPDFYGHELFNALLTDYASLNRAYIEVVRGNVVNPEDASISKKVTALYHVPATTIRKTKKDSVPVLVPTKLKRFGKVLDIKAPRYFRRYAQKVESLAAGARNYIYFKEFEDPRNIHKYTGQVLNELEAREAASKGELATEIFEIADYEPNEVYALPVWINQLNAILGSKLCNEVNLSFFENNTIPSMVVLVSGGGLTDNSYKEVKKAFENIKGGQSFNKILFLEAVGDEDAASEDGSIPVPKLEMKPLKDVQQDDAIFQKYKDSTNRTILSSYRIDPILVGLAEAADKAAAEVAVLAAEAEVFGPLRKKIEDFISKVVVVDENGFPDKDWALKFRPTNVMKQESIFTAIRYGLASGALTPNAIIAMLNNSLNIDIPAIKEFWGDIPSTSVRDTFKAYIGSLEARGYVIESEAFEEFLEEFEYPQEIPQDPKQFAPDAGTFEAQGRSQQ